MLARTSVAQQARPASSVLPGEKRVDHGRTQSDQYLFRRPKPCAESGVLVITGPQDGNSCQLTEYESPPLLPTLLPKSSLRHAPVSRASSVSLGDRTVTRRSSSGAMGLSTPPQSSTMVPPPRHATCSAPAARQARTLQSKAREHRAQNNCLVIEFWDSSSLCR